MDGLEWLLSSVPVSFPPHKQTLIFNERKWLQLLDSAWEWTLNRYSTCWNNELFQQSVNGQLPSSTTRWWPTKDQCRTVFQLHQKRKRDEQQNLKIKNSIFWMYGCMVGRGAMAFVFSSVSFYIFIISYFWLQQVFVALRRLSLIVESRLLTAVASLVVECRL